MRPTPTQYTPKTATLLAAPLTAFPRADRSGAPGRSRTASTARQTSTAACAPPAAPPPSRNPLPRTRAPGDFPGELRLAATTRKRRRSHGSSTRARVDRSCPRASGRSPHQRLLLRLDDHQVISHDTGDIEEHDHPEPPGTRPRPHVPT